MKILFLRLLIISNLIFINCLANPNEIANTKSQDSALIKWVKDNKKRIIITASILGGISTLGGIYWYYRSNHRKEPLRNDKATSSKSSAPQGPLKDLEDEEFKKHFGRLQSNSDEVYLEHKRYNNVGFMCGKILKGCGGDSPLLRKVVRKFLDLEAIDRGKIGYVFLPDGNNFDDDFYQLLYNYCDPMGQNEKLLFNEVDKDYFSEEELNNIREKIVEDFNKIKLNSHINVEIPKPLLDKMLLIRLKTNRMREKRKAK